MCSLGAFSTTDRPDDDTRRRVLAALLELDGRLRELSAALDSLSDHSPLPLLRADLTELQQRMLAQQLRRLRNAIGEVLRRHQLSAPQPSDGALQACRVVLHQAFTAVEALRPNRQRDGARLSDEDEAELRRSVAYLLPPLDDMQHILDAHDVPAGRAEADVESLSRIVSTHRLSEMESALAEFASHQAAPGLVIAVLGQANAGKSSLLNRLLQNDLLPVDALPASAIPVRLQYGRVPSGSARFARTMAPEIFPLARLAEFASARDNPDNKKQVTQLVFALPSPRLADGVCLLDSPPWVVGTTPLACDVGLVLIDAGGSLGLEEIAMIDTLRDAGSEVIVLLSKVDRLSERDRWEVLGYVRQRLWTDHASQPPVFPVSSVSPDDLLWNDWLSRGLERCVMRRDALRQASLRCKKLRLQTAIANHLKGLAGAAAEREDERLALARREGLGLIDSALRRELRPATEAHTQALRVIQEIGHNVAELAWKSGETALQFAPMIEASLRARVLAAQQDVRREMAMLAVQCADLLAATVGPPFVWHAQETALPGFDGTALPANWEIHRPWCAGLGAWALRRYLHWVLHRHCVRDTIETLLRNHLAQFDAWRRSALADLRQAYGDTCDRRSDGAARIPADLAYLQVVSRPLEHGAAEDASAAGNGTPARE